MYLLWDKDAFSLLLKKDVIYISDFIAGICKSFLAKIKTRTVEITYYFSFHADL